MKISQTSLKGVFIIEPDVFGDGRGYFLETYNQKRYQKFDWPVKNPIISEKDQKFSHLSEIHPQFLPDLKN